MLAEAQSIRAGNGGPIPTVAEMEQEYNEFLADEDCTILVAFIQGEFAGFIQAVIEEHDDELVQAPYMTIYNLATADRFQGRGVASSLIDRLEQYAAKHGIATLDLLVWSSNTRAIRLYEKLGYHVMEHRMAKRIDQV